MDRDGAADEASTATLGHHGEFSFIAVAKDGAHLLCRLGLEHKLGRALVLFSPVCVMNVKVFLFCDHSFATEHPLKERDILLKRSKPR